MRQAVLFRRICGAGWFRAGIVLCSLVLSGVGVAAQQPATQPLTNAAVIRLVRAGFKEKTLISIIRARPSRFDLAADRLIDLKKAGVSENVILAMIGHQEAVDAFAFDDSLDDMAGVPGNGSGEAGGADIFGSGGSSSSSSRGNGQSGSSSGNSMTTGTATVRIVRPPVEEGGAPKLEKTPTLHNESIVAMVEAGFSEGTIIRRIEQSPAEFDLSAVKLADLRKRRVTEPVIEAMRSAMGEESTSEPPQKNKNPEK